MTGLREAHAHIAMHGREMAQLNLAACGSRGECLERLAAEASRLDAAREAGWLIANGVRVEAWAEGGPVWPTLAELDRVSPRRPCMVQSFDHHACAVNTAALAASGFTGASADPPGGRIVRDGSGAPTGLLLESAFGAARNAVPEPSAKQRKAQVAVALDDLVSHGFVEVHDLLAPVWLGPVLRELEREGRMPMESVWLYVPLKELEAAAAGASAWESPRLSLAGAKVFVDGTLNSRTALMLHEYADPIHDLPRGQAMMTPGELDAAFGSVHDWLGPHGHLAAHAIGDGAVRMVLDSIERANPECDEQGMRARIEHCELIDEADVHRFARLGVIASVQPCHLLADIEALQRGQPHRLDRVLPLRELLAAGCRAGGDGSGGGEVWFGSDVPIVRPHPGDSLFAAVHRRRPGMGPNEAIGPGQAIDEGRALACFRAG